MRGLNQRRLSIGVDARSLCGPLSGIGHYVHEVLKAIDEIADVQLHLYCAPKPPAIQLRADWRVRTVSMPRQVAVRTIFGRWAKQDKIDVFWAPQTILPKGNFPKVVTVHDLNHILVPETMSWGTLLAHRLWFEGDVLKANRVVSNSSGTSERLVQYCGRHSNAEALPGIHPRYRPLVQNECVEVLSRYRIQANYLLAVGTLEPRKNIQTLVRAHASLYSAGLAPELILVGRMGWGKSLSSDSFPGVRLLGYVRDDDLPALFSAASAFVIPSLYEGYGMPAAEARACGVNIMATDIPELREAAGPGAVFVNSDEDSIREGLVKVISLPRQLDFEAPIRWESTAKVYLDQFISAVESA